MIGRDVGATGRVRVDDRCGSVDALRRSPRGFPVPHDEQDRLLLLHAAQVLDTPPEEVFDDLVRTAAQICQVPIALVSLVDETRQWFKARVGTSRTETPREEAFCARAIMSRDLMTVPDALVDHRFVGLPLVVDDGVRFYAGVPLVASDGSELGTLCVMDRVPRELDGVQLQLLRRLAAQAAAHLELRARLTRLSELLIRDDAPGRPGDPHDRWITTILETMSDTVVTVHRDVCTADEQSAEVAIGHRTGPMSQETLALVHPDDLDRIMALIGSDNPKPPATPIVFRVLLADAPEGTLGRTGWGVQLDGYVVVVHDRQPRSLRLV